MERLLQLRIGGRITRPATGPTLPYWTAACIWQQPWQHRPLQVRLIRAIIAFKFPDVQGAD